MRFLLVRFFSLFSVYFLGASLFLGVLSDCIVGTGAVSFFDRNVLILSLVTGFFSALIISEFCDRRSYEKSIITSVKILQEKYKQAVRETSDEVFLFLLETIVLADHKEKNKIILSLGSIKGLFLKKP